MEGEKDWVAGLEASIWVRKGGLGWVELSRFLGMRCRRIPQRAAQKNVLCAWQARNHREPSQALGGFGSRKADSPGGYL